MRWFCLFVGYSICIYIVLHNSLYTYKYVLNGSFETNHWEANWSITLSFPWLIEPDYSQESSNLGWNLTLNFKIFNPSRDLIAIYKFCFYFAYDQRQFGQIYDTPKKILQSIFLVPEEKIDTALVNIQVL